MSPIPRQLRCTPSPLPFPSPPRSEIQSYAGEAFRHNGINLRLGTK